MKLQENIWILLLQDLWKHVFKDKKTQNEFQKFNIRLSITGPKKVLWIIPTCWFFVFYFIWTIFLCLHLFIWKRFYAQNTYIILLNLILIFHTVQNTGVNLFSSFLYKLYNSICPQNSVVCFDTNQYKNIFLFQNLLMLIQEEIVLYLSLYFISTGAQEYFRFHQDTCRSPCKYHLTVHVEFDSPQF